MKKIVFIILSVITGLLAVSASIEFGKILRNFSLSSKDELSFGIGFVTYLLVHFLFYKPVFMHVMAHELTHALWALPFGGKTKELKVSKEGGRVLISKSNFLISLAPYFFPLYALFFALIYLIARDEFRFIAAFLTGAALSFHIALTLFSLKSNQSDFHADSDFIFSIIFVYFMNIIMISLVLTALSPKINFLGFMSSTFKGCYHIVRAALAGINNGLK
jgi:hypothetical protein